MKKVLMSAIVLLGLYAQYLSAEDEAKKDFFDLPLHSTGYVLPVPFSSYIFTGRSLYVVHQEKEGEGQKITRAHGRKGVGLVPDQVMLDYKKQPNPLYNDSIDFIAVNHEERLCVAGKKDPSRLFLVTAAQGESTIAMISACGINDACGAATAGIVGLASGSIADRTEAGPYTLVAVKKHEGHFGQEGSGIALLRYDPDIKEKDTDKKNKKDSNDDEPEEPEKDKEESKPFFDILDATQGTSGGNQACPLDFARGPLSINNGLESIEYDVVDMHWNDALRRCYIAVQAKTKDGAQDDQGVCALLVARIENRKLFLEPIVPHDALRGNAAILGATGSGSRVSLHKVRIMFLNNGLPYLVVVGGNGSCQETSSSVYAFPVVTTHASGDRQQKNKQGTLAKKGSIPTLACHSQGSIAGRFFENPAMAKEDFYTTADFCVNVGGLGKLPGPITHIAVRGDCVIVTVPEDGNGMAAGTFYSQAIMNEHGAVAAWTAWSRIPGGAKKSLCAFPSMGEFSSILEYGQDHWLQTYKTGWHIPQELNKDVSITLDPLQACVENIFFGKGLYGLTDYPSAMHGVSGKDQVSMLVALGAEKVALIQTAGLNEQGVVAPFHEPYTDIFSSYDGSLTHFSMLKERTVRAISITGGAVAECGGLSSSAIGVHGNNAWLFVAGTNGLAVLTKKDGSGWDARLGVQARFQGLHDDFSFKKIGNYRYVRKIICCREYLYVLTNKSLDRISLSAQQFKRVGGIKPETIAAVTKDSYGKKMFFNDILVSQKLLLLATSEGLFSATPSSQLILDKVELSEAQLPIINLSALSRTGHACDFASHGQVYVVARSCNYKETFIYRLFVDADCGAEKAVRVFNDGYRKDEQDCWIHYITQQQGFMSDGISLYSYCSRLKNRPPHLSLIAFPDIRTKNILRGGQLIQLPLMLEEAHAIRSMIRSSATGNLLVAGDFGLRVNT